MMCMDSSFVESGVNGSGVGGLRCVWTLAVWNLVCMDSGVCELWCVWTREYGLSSLYGFGVYGLYCVDSGVYGSGVCALMWVN